MLPLRYKMAPCGQAAPAWLAFCRQRWIFRAVGPRAIMAPSRIRPVLAVVGSLAGLSRRQVAVLSETNEVVVVTVRPQGLLAGPDTQEWRDGRDLIVSALGTGRDVLTLAGAEERLNDDMAPRLSNAPACLLGPCRAAMGGLVPTGGETARAVLGAFGVRVLVPVREAEPRCPFGSGFHRKWGTVAGDHQGRRFWRL